MQCAMAVVALFPSCEATPREIDSTPERCQHRLAGPDAKPPRQSRTFCAVAWQCRINLKHSTTPAGDRFGTSPTIT